MRPLHAFTSFVVLSFFAACGSSGVDQTSSVTSSGATTGAEGATTSTAASTSASTGTGGAGQGGSGGQGGAAQTSTGAGGASATSTATTTASSTSGAGGAAGDADGDGLDDAFEAQIAADYMPFLSLDPADACPLGGMLYRVTPHPVNPGFLWVIYDHLYQNDCGLNGHVGDDEVFGVTVDPSKPAPAGILAIKAISHQNTPCQNISECGQCPGQTKCDTQMKNGKSYPAVYASKDKHGSYAQKCSFVNCLDSCTLAATEAPIPMQNAGEPNAHLTEDLTANGFITAANGWTEVTLFNFNPWDPMKDFGAAGNVAGDLADTSFVAAACP